MTWLGQQERTIFLGQSVVYPGNAIFKTLSGVPDSKKIEMPVAEDMQMGLSTGLSLEGFIPVSIFPRMDFLLLAINQLTNHLDKIQDMSPFRPHVIIRTSIGATKPFYPGLQHCGYYTDAFRALVSNVKVVKAIPAHSILSAKVNVLKPIIPIFGSFSIRSSATVSQSGLTWTLFITIATYSHWVY